MNPNGKAPRRQFLFTIDVDWIPGSQVGLEELYRFCDEHALPASLFITGRFAEAYPALIREGAARGYQIGTHGWEHGQKGRASEEDFQRAPYASQREWVERSTEAVEKASGVRPVAFRAPNLWVSETTLRVLEELEYEYDSSVPVRRLTTGYSRPNSLRYYRAPLGPYRPARENLGARGSSRVLEIPPSTYFFPINMSALRVLGLARVLWAVRRVARRAETLVFYSHPAEFVPFAEQEIPGDVPQRFQRGIGPENFEVLARFVEYVKGLGYEPALCSQVRA
ncbi:MAG TPA: polysaccharide deacetylase family protein [Longimicrobium sp.]